MSNRINRQNRWLLLSLHLLLCVSLILTLLQGTVFGSQAAAGDTIIYGANGYNVNTIFEINLTQNSSQLVGTLLFGTQAIEQDPDSGYVYYYEWQRSGDEFAYWDPATGNSTVARVYTPSPRIYAKRMAFHPNGTLYMMENNDRLYTINQHTGDLTLLGKVSGLEIGDLGATGDMAFAPDGTLYVATYQSLYTVDIPSRTATLLYSGMLSGTGIVVWSGLAFCSGMLYGSSIEESSGGTNIYRINPGSGQTDFLFASEGVLNDLSSCSTAANPPANQAPVAGDDAYSTDAETPLGVNAPGVLGNDSDPNGDNLSAVLNTGPSNGALTLNANGSFTYTPNAGFSGTDSFSYFANDGELNSSPATVTITVNAPIPPNNPPSAVDDVYSTEAGTPLGINAPGVLSNDSDPDNDPLFAVLISPAANGALNLNADGSFSYTPNAGFSGTDSFTYRANDGELDSNTATVTITVNAPVPVNDPPTAVNDAYSTEAGTPLGVNAPGVLGNDSDPENDPLSAVLSAAPANGALTLNADGSFSYTPNTGFSGTDSFTYLANDGELDSNTATVTITVSPPTPVNNPPSAVDDAYSTGAETPLAVSAPGILGNDSEPDGDNITAALNTGPANGALTLNADGSFSYTPNTGFSGTDSFTYRANDGELDSSPAAVTITVNAPVPTNDPPTAVDDAYNTDSGTPLGVNAPGVLGNDSDPDGDNLTAVLNTGPANGTLTLNANGSFTYTPDSGFNGTDGFTYLANDGELNSSPAAVTINVFPTVPAGDLITFGANAYNLNEIFAIDLSQGHSYKVGDLLFGSLAIELDPQTNYMYYFEWQRSASRFAYWNPATGQNTLVRTYNPKPNVNFTRMAFHPNGTLYMMDDRDRLYTIDKNNGNITSLGTTSGMVTGEYRGTGDMAFAPNGTLYVVTNQHLYTLNLATRQATLIAADMISGSEIIIWSGLAYCDGMLYAADIQHNSGVDSSAIYSIDPSDGEVDFLFFNQNFVNDFTSCSAFPPPPPQNLSLQAAGLVLDASLNTAFAETPSFEASLTRSFFANASSEMKGVGVMGDSNSDEYRADDNRGRQYAATTLNWVEQLVLRRGVNFGPWGEWGEPRRIGYKYNWARSGATAGTLIREGQHTGLAKQIASGEVTHAVLHIGANDFHLSNGTYEDIYNGSLNGLKLQEKIDRVAEYIVEAADTVLAAGDVKLVIYTISDPGETAFAHEHYPDPVKRQRVTAAINAVNTRIAAAAAARGVPIADPNNFSAQTLARVDQSGNLNVGGELITMRKRGDEPHHMQLDDKTGHVGTVMSGLMANALFIDTFNSQYGTNITPLSDAEILQNAGIQSPPKPRVLQFSATQLAGGNLVKLTWEVDGVLRLQIDPQAGTVPVKGELTVRSTPNTRFTLTGQGPGGSVTASVQALPGTGPGNSQLIFIPMVSN